MKSKSVKKFLTVALVATMVMASTLTVAASSGGSGGSSGSGSSSSSSSSSSGSSSSSTTSTVAAEAGTSDGSGEASAPAPSVPVYGANAAIAVAGSAVRTTIAGAYDVKVLQGAAVTTPLAEVAASLGLTGSQTPYIMVFDTNPQKSYLAMNCVNAAAESLGGQVVGAINVTLGAKENGRLVTLTSGSAGMVVGLPKNADPSKTYCVVCVQPGGVITILNDVDSSPATVTFDVSAGIGTYGIVAR